MHFSSYRAKSVFALKVLEIRPKFMVISNESRLSYVQPGIK